ncbi:hypothetical protein D3C76_1567680 [compost metagenome]
MKDNGGKKNGNRQLGRTQNSSHGFPNMRDPDGKEQGRDKCSKQAKQQSVDKQRSPEHAIKQEMRRE